MIYKKGPLFRVRPVQDICEDIDEAYHEYGNMVKTIFFPAGNSIAMATEDLDAICRYSRIKFPGLERITVYGSSQYIVQKGQADLNILGEAGLRRIHVGLESGDDQVLRRVKKGTCSEQQIEAGQMVKAAGIQLSEYIILGLGGVERSDAHAQNTAEAINAIEPDFVRLRTLVPKINTLLLHQIKNSRFLLLSPHQVLKEARRLIENLHCHTTLTSDHYTNYLNLTGKMPEDKDRLLSEIDQALNWDAHRFRPFFIGTH